jgi:hypothetical protein
MSSKWNKYRALLSKEHEAKYSVILADNKEKCKINSDLVDQINTIHDLTKDRDEYINIIDKMPGNTEGQRRLRQQAYMDLVIKYYSNFETLCDKREIARRAYISSENKLVSFRSAVYILYEIPEPKGTPTDDETKQCSICVENIKDYALPCGHIYCIECVGKMKSECPTCKKGFVKDKVIKLYL